MTNKQKIDAIDYAIGYLLNHRYNFMCVALFQGMREVLGKEETILPAYNEVHEHFPELLNFSNYTSWNDTNPFSCLRGLTSESIWGYVLIDGISIPLLYFDDIDEYVKLTPNSYIVRARVLELLKEYYSERAINII